MVHWKRRDLIGLVVAAWPVAAPAQQPEMPAMANGSSPDPAFARATAAVNEKLKDSQSARYGGMVRKVGPNVKGKPAEVVCGSVSTRSSSGQYDAKRPFVYFIADGATDHVSLALGNTERGEAGLVWQAGSGADAQLHFRLLSTSGPPLSNAGGQDRKSVV